jgi:hypothetical protein
MHELCQGSGLSLPAPPVKERSPEFQKRLSKLQDDLDNKMYAAMVADITEKDREAEDRHNALFPTYRLQLSFGMHVIVTMGTFFLLGYYAGKLSFKSPTAVSCSLLVVQSHCSACCSCLMMAIKASAVPPCMAL